MQKYECGICGYVYDPANGDPMEESSGRPVRTAPVIMECPVCGASKENFKPVVE